MRLSMNEIPRDAMVYADKGQLQQALLNLILNALAAMPEGGDLLIEASREREGKVQILVKDTVSAYLMT